MAVLAKGDLLIGDVLMTARAAALSPHYAMIATDPRKTVMDRQEAALSAEALVVALSQPHRRDGKRAGDALAAYCERMRLRRECWAAGEQYDREVRAEKAAKGFDVIGQGHVIDPEPLTEEEIEAKNQAAIMSLRAANEELLAVHARCPAAMERLCYNRLPPSPYDEAMLVAGLLGLARHYGLLDEGINRDKGI